MSTPGITITIRTTQCHDCFTQSDAILSEVITVDPEANHGNPVWESGFANMMEWRKTHRDHTKSVTSRKYSAQRIPD